MKGLMHFAILNNKSLTACLSENRQDFKETLPVKFDCFLYLMLSALLSSQKEGFMPMCVLVCYVCVHLTVNSFALVPQRM